MGISSAGIGSGLDVNAIVTSLMGIEQKPLSAVTTQKTANQAKISAYGSLSSALSNFQTTVNALSTLTAFNAQNVSSSDSTLATATASGTATTGSYALTVNQLATSQKIASAGVADTNTAIGTGNLNITFGTYLTGANSFTPNNAKAVISINIDSSNNTLTGVRDAINAANVDVSATIVNNGTSNQLVITSKSTGEINSLKISVTDNDGNHTDVSGLSQLAFDPTAANGNGKNMYQVQAAQNAHLNIDGINVIKDTNSISDVIAGVTLNLISISTSVVNVSVTTNQDKVKSSVSAFVDGYNKLDTTLRGLTKFGGAGNSSGVLLGDATARTVMSQIKSMMTKAMANSGNLTSLNEIGISFQSGGQLALDTTKLNTAISNRLSDIAALFATSAKASDAKISYVSSSSKTQAGTYAVKVTNMSPLAGTINGATALANGTSLVGAVGDVSEGLSLNVIGGGAGDRGTVNFSLGYASQLSRIATSLLGTDGLIASRTNGITTANNRLDKQALSIQARLTKIEARYRAQYTQLDTLMSSMSSTSSALTQQLASINVNNTKVA